MSNESENKYSKDLNIGRDNHGQIINELQGNLIQTQKNYIIRIFQLLSEQALKGSIVGVVIGLSLIFISHTIFFPIVKDYTISAKCAEFVAAIFVGLYCRLFCSHHINRKSHKNFLAALAFVVTWFVLPSIRQTFLSMFTNSGDRNTADTISYAISYAIICVLAGGVIETIAQLNSRKTTK